MSQAKRSEAKQETIRARDLYSPGDSVVQCQPSEDLPGRPPVGLPAASTEQLDRPLSVTINGTDASSAI
jgi:hypothetical protein